MRVARQERCDNVEHGVTEATNVQDVRPFWSLRVTVRLDVDANQLWGHDVVATKSQLPAAPLRAAAQAPEMK